MRTRRGFAFMAAVILMMLIASAVAVLSVTFAHQARRTAQASTSTQLRQLLLSAEPIARAELERGSTPRTVTAPTPLKDATLTLDLGGENPLEVRITATWHGQTARQTLRYAIISNAQHPFVVGTATLTSSP